MVRNCNFVVRNGKLWYEMVMVQNSYGTKWFLVMVRNCNFVVRNGKLWYEMAMVVNAVLAVDDRHVAFCEYNGNVARIICVAVATLANKKLLERASDNDLLLCRKSTSNKTRYRQ